MINIIILFDDIAGDIGYNCRLSYEHLIQHVSLDKFNVQLLNGHDCRREKVEEIIISFDSQPFILVAYSHGRTDALISTVEYDGYLNKHNSYFFGKSLVYTNSCHSAVKLKQTLIDSGCSGYVGYNDEVSIPYDEEDQKVFILCENKALVNFLSTDDTLSSSVKAMEHEYMKQYYNYISLDETEKIIIGGLLRDNYYLLEFHDCDLITRNSFS